MPTNRRKRIRDRAGGIDHWKLDDLVTGDCFLSVGYTPPNNRNGCAYWTESDWAEVHAAMRDDWLIHGPAIMAWWRGENERWTYWGDCREDQREKLREWIGRHGETEPFAFRRWGLPH